MKLYLLVKIAGESVPWDGSIWLYGIFSSESKALEAKNSNSFYNDADIAECAIDVDEGFEIPNPVKSVLIWNSTQSPG